MKLSRLLIFFIISIVTLLIYIVLFLLPSKNKFSDKILLIPSPTPLIRKESLQVRASIPYWDQDRAFSSFKNHLDSFSTISFFWYYLSEDGNIVPYEHAQEDQNLINFAHEYGVKVSAVITNLPDDENSEWESKRVENVLSESESRTEHINNIVEVLEEFEFDGVEIDYEEVEPHVKDDFTTFIKELSVVVHKHSKFVGVALHPKIESSQDKRYKFQDWKALSDYADELYVMAYNEHSDGEEPGPIASTRFVKRIIRYVQDKKIPLDKLLLGIPLYGYDWIGSSAKGLTYEEVEKLRAKHNAKRLWDISNHEPYFFYTFDRETHEVWYEDAESVIKKVQLANNAGFNGIFFWRLGGEDLSIWTKILNFKQQ